MKIYFDASNSGFYLESGEGRKEITEDDRDDIMARSMAEHKIIVPDENGYPTLQDPPPFVPKIPSSISRFQAQAALYNAGMLAEVEAMMQAPDTDMLAKLAWGSAQEFRRSSPLIAELAVQLELTDEQLDGLFLAASEIQG